MYPNTITITFRKWANVYSVLRAYIECCGACYNIFWVIMILWEKMLQLRYDTILISLEMTNILRTLSARRSAECLTFSDTPQVRSLRNKYTRIYGLQSIIPGLDASMFVNCIPDTGEIEVWGNVFENNNNKRFNIVSNIHIIQTSLKVGSMTKYIEKKT